MNILNVLYQSNDNYAMVTGISILSLFENNKSLEQINIYILDDQITEENKEKLRQLCDRYRRSLHFIDTTKILEKLKSLHVSPFRNSYTTYFKLMALKNLTVPGDRILQIDGDTIINHSLEALCSFDLTGSICAASYECVLNKYKSLVGIPENEHYYNCGVLLINQPMWVSENCEERIVKHLKEVRNGYYTVDQDIINVLFRKKIKHMDLTYNFNSGFYIYGVKESLKLYRLKESYYYSEEHIRETMKDPMINHCMGAMTGRPWEKDSIHPQNELFDRYFVLSPWADCEKKTVRRSAIFRAQRFLYTHLPRPMYIPIHRAVLHWHLRKMNRLVQQ